MNSVKADSRAKLIIFIYSIVYSPTCQSLTNLLLFHITYLLQSPFLHVDVDVSTSYPT